MCGIPLRNILIKTTILTNKIKLKDTNIYIQVYLSRYIYNIFYITRKLKTENKISKTWIYNSNTFILTNSYKNIQIINKIHLDNISIK